MPHDFIASGRHVGNCARSDIIETGRNLFAECSDGIPLFYWRQPGLKNLGDVLGKYMVEKMSGLPAIDADPEIHDRILVTIGSVINQARAEQSVFWGSGFISASMKPNPRSRYVAVRGPLSGLLLERSGIKAPSAIGDPALLMPLLYRPDRVRKYRLGIVPHYSDRAGVLRRLDRTCLDEEGDVALINIATDRVEGFIGLICQCDFIVSSSLHGIIIAHAYGIPAVWVEFSDALYGDGMKFKDYFLSVSIPPYRPHQFKDEVIPIRSLMKLARRGSTLSRIVNHDPRPLLDCCPFIDDDARQRMICALDQGRVARG